MSATDADGTVTSMSITSVTPSPAPGHDHAWELRPGRLHRRHGDRERQRRRAVPSGAYSVVVSAPEQRRDAANRNLHAEHLGRRHGCDPRHPGRCPHLSACWQPVETEGIVTAKSRTASRIQEPNAGVDGDVATSEGIFVFTGGAPIVAVGDGVEVTGLVTEFRPGGSAQPNLTTTELTSPTTTVQSSGNALPGPQLVGRGGRIALAW